MIGRCSVREEAKTKNIQWKKYTSQVSTHFVCIVLELERMDGNVNHDPHARKGLKVRSVALAGPRSWGARNDILKALFNNVST